MWGMFREPWNGEKVRKIVVQELQIGDSFWFLDEKNSEVKRKVEAVHYFPKRKLVHLYYDGYVGADVWGATAEVHVVRE